MNKKILMFAILGMFLISFASALTYTVNEEVNLTVTCLNDGYCSNTTQCNINVIDPDGDIIVDGQNMTYNINSFDYEITNTLNGEYLVTGFCLDGSMQDEINYNYEVTPTGKTINIQEAILYGIMLTALIIFLFISAYGAVTLPYSNNRNSDGKIISTNDLKYVKILSFFFAYGILTWLANIMIVISNNYINIGIALSFFTLMFKVMIAMIYPTLIFTIIMIVIEAIKDSKLNKLLNRGL